MVRTYAPRRQTPLMHPPLTRDHLSVISGITPDEPLFLQVQPRPFRGPDVVRFLRHLLRPIPGTLLVFWDGAPIHRGLAAQDLLAQGGAHLERLPGYAPELNPDEGIWHYLKHVELRNLCYHDLPELRAKLRLATARLRHEWRVIQACFRNSGHAV